MGFNIQNIILVGLVRFECGSRVDLEFNYLKKQQFMLHKNVAQVEVSYIPHVTIPINYGIKEINPIFALNLQ